MTRFVISLLSTSFLLALAGEAARAADKSAKIRGYVGTYTGGSKSEGIYLIELDPSSGKLTRLGATGGVDNPSFVAIHPSRRFLYSVGEVGGGVVAAFAVDPRTGELKLLNTQSSGGGGPCHLVVDKTGKSVLAANYGGGSVCVLPIGDDGKLGERTAFIQHKGSSVDKNRQEAPHAHSINLDPGNRFAFVADLGLDQVLVYKFDAMKGTLAANDPPAAKVAPGSGPRHFAFHPSGRFAYVINEMALTVTAFSYDAQRGVLTELQTIDTLPPDADRRGASTAEVQVHPSGKFLYGSNRGHNTIAVFTIDEQTGRLTAAGHQSTGGKTPRNFGIDPTGAYLLACNQDSDSIVVLAIDAKSGRLTPSGQSLEIPRPVCVKMFTVE